MVTCFSQVLGSEALKQIGIAEHPNCGNGAFKDGAALMLQNIHSDLYHCIIDTSKEGADLRQYCRIYQR